MFRNESEQEDYIIENYPEVSDSRIDDDHWDLFCPSPECQIVRGFQVIERSEGRTKSQMYGGTYNTDYHAPFAIYFRCPTCKTYKQWVMYKVTRIEEVDGKKIKPTRYYRVTSLPNEGLEEIDELPIDPPALRKAYKQAIRAMDANAHIAAAAMFRRALQVITRDILKATHGNLGSELKNLVGKKYNGVTISNDFSNIAYVIKEAGNQGAHPDEDMDLLDFTQEDSEDLQKIFMELVSELFVEPIAQKKTRDDFLKRRKISVPKSG